MDFDPEAERLSEQGSDTSSQTDTSGTSVIDLDEPPWSKKARYDKPGIIRLESEHGRMDP